MTDPRKVHRFTILGVPVIVLGGCVFAPALALGFVTFIGGGGMLIGAAVLLALILLVPLAVVLARAFRPR